MANQEQLENLKKGGTPVHNSSMKPCSRRIRGNLIYG